MTDDLDRLKAALTAQEPAPNPGARDRALALALENFDRLQASPQGTEARPRSMSDRPSGAGFFHGVKKMLIASTGKSWLAATTSAAALIVGVGVLWPVLTQQPAEEPGVTLTLGEETAKAPKPVLSDDLALKTDAPAAEPAPLDAAPLTRTAPALTGGLDEDLAGATTVAPATAPLMDALASEQESDRLLLAPPPAPTTEAFANAAPNPVTQTSENPVSTFSIDVDTASWSVIRNSLSMGQLPPPDAVRVEEMLNYFPYTWPKPTAEAAFRPTVEVMPTPWNPDTRLVTIAVQGRTLDARPPLDLVFLVDTSGSMDEPAKLPLLKQALGLMLGQLGPDDRLAIVTYAGSAGIALPATKASDRAAIIGALDTLAAGGGTAGAEGIALAYQVARDMKGTGDGDRVSRVILATDGDFNLGISDPDALKTYIADQRQAGLYLNVLGFGRGNLDDATMQALAQNGNGTAAYIDTLAEAQKVLVDQVQGALLPIADDVKIQVEWNPAEVAEWRLIGYETRALAREDFTNDRVDAGEIGAGASVVAIYEVTAPGSPALRLPPLRYGDEADTPAPEPTPTGELGYLKLRWKAPGAATSTEMATPILTDQEAGPEARFAAAIAGMGQLLTGGRETGTWGWNEAIALAQSAKGEDPFGYRAEAITLMRLAQSLQD